MSEAAKWIRLDNAGTIYPAASRRNWTALFRISAELTVAVDPEILYHAQMNVLKRIPLFATRLKKGIFWYYLESTSDAPRIQRDVGNPCVRMRMSETDGFCFRVRYYEKRIAVEVFHVLTDGTGGLVFFETLLAEYLKLAQGESIPRGGMILDCADEPLIEEQEDAYVRYCRKFTRSYAEPSSFRLRGTDEPRERIHLISGKLPADVVKQKAAEMGVSLTEYLTAVLILSVDAIQKRRVRNPARYKPCKVSVPVNLRRFFPTKSLRNFASYVNPGIDPRFGEYSFKEVCDLVHCHMGLEVNEKQLAARFSMNVKNATHPVLRVMPRVVKDKAMRMVFEQVGDKKSTTCLSNLGVARLPEEMAKYVRRMDFILGPLSLNCVAGAAITYKNKLIVTFTRTIAEPVLEREFFTRLVKLGIPVKITSNRSGMDALKEG